MKINTLKMTNFGSYYGDSKGNKLDFKTKTGVNGYAIFGEAGRGKTTIVKAILWCLYGNVEVSHMFDGMMQSRNRPVVDAKQMRGDFAKTWYPPLLTDKAFENDEYTMKVHMEFTHNDRKYSLLREAKAAKKHPKDDDQMSIKAHLTIDGKVVPKMRIEAAIGEVMPSRVSRFFFVEMDAIERYSALLFGAEPSDQVREDVEVILGLPAIDESQQDFTSLAKSTDRMVAKLRKKQGSDKRLRKKLDTVEEKITDMERDIDLFGQQIDQLSVQRDDIEVQLSTERSTEVMMNEKKLIEEELSTIKSELDDLYSKRARLLGGSLWMSLIQPGIESVLTNLENMNSKKEGLSSEKIRAEAKIEFKDELLSKGETECEQCGHITEGIELDRKEKEAKEVAELRAKVTELQTQIESLGDPSSSIVSLSKYRNPTGYSQLSEIEHTIAEKLMLTRTKTRKRKGILDELETHDVQAVAELALRRTNLTEHIGSLKVERATAKKMHEEAVATRSKLEGKLPSEDDTPKIKEAVKMNEVYEWLSEGFMKAMDKYKEVARKSVESQSTNAFLAMIPEPEKYNKIAISKKWDVEVIGSNGKAKVIVNPGHKQTLAVSIFDGLRKTSKHHFPTFFDNPGSNISDNILDRMVDYFWDEENDQVVMLSHGGGLKTKETMENYGDRLARAWELSYVKGETLTQVKEIR